MNSTGKGDVGTETFLKTIYLLASRPLGGGEIPSH